MARPSRKLDDALLRSGRALYPALGCAALSIRQVALHAGVAPGMFHYHFRTKDEFLGRVLQAEYDEMFDRLAALSAHQGPARDRLQAALQALGGFVRDHRDLVGRVWADAQQGQPVAQAFLRANAPRHLGVLMQLAQQAQDEGALDAMPAMARVVFLMGAVVAPLIVAPGLIQLGVAPELVQRQAPAQVLSDRAIAARAALALRAMEAGAAPPARARRRKELA